MKSALKALCAVPAVFAGSAACYLPFVFADAARSFDDGCDYLIILGSGVIGADTPSPALALRVERAAEYMKAHPAVIAVPTGGCFRKEQKVSEANIIKRGLLEAGIDESRIIPEGKATTTYENFIFSFEIIERLSGKNITEVSVAALSSSYHMHRCALIAKQCGRADIGRVAARTPEGLKPWVREYFVAYEILLKILRRKS